MGNSAMEPQTQPWVKFIWCSGAIKGQFDLWFPQEVDIHNVFEYSGSTMWLKHPTNYGEGQREACVIPKRHCNQNAVLPESTFKPLRRDHVRPLTECTRLEKVIADLLKCHLVVTKAVSSDCCFLPAGWDDKETRNVAAMTRSNRHVICSSQMKIAAVCG